MFMNRFLMLGAPVMLLMVLVIPFAWLFYGRKKQDFSIRSKRAVRLNLASFFGVLLLLVLATTVGVFASEGDMSYIDAVSAAPLTVTMTTGAGIAYLGAALSTGLSSLGAGIAVAAAAPAAIGACSEDPKAMGKSLVFIALGEGVALYGLIISVMIIGALN